MRAVLFTVVALSLFYQCSAEEIHYGPGVMAPSEPQQARVSNVAPFEWEGYQIKPLASFDIEARVLSKARYRMGRQAEISPIDLALGWGPMSDESVLKDIKISQSGRFYHWRAARMPIPARVISSHSANMHLIPANDEVDRVMKNETRKGSIVQFSGYLVSISAEDGWRWRSSLTRKDAGKGACELVWVKQMKVL